MLLASETLPRHADTVEVVLSALTASVAGTGHRTIAADLDVPVDTVRTWIRRVTGHAESLRVAATRWAHSFDPERQPIEPTGSALGDALAAIATAAAATRARLAMTATVAAGRDHHRRAAREAARRSTRRLITGVAQGTPTPSPRRHHDHQPGTTTEVIVTVSDTSAFYVVSVHVAVIVNQRVRLHPGLVWDRPRGIILARSPDSRRSMVAALIFTNSAAS